MKITKSNYNELRTQELDNNFAKVWHVNEVREELLNNTPTGGVTTVNGLIGNITFQGTGKSFTFTPTQDDAENGTIFVETGINYHELYLELTDDGETVTVTHQYTNTVDFVGSGNSLAYTADFSDLNNTYTFTGDLTFTADFMNIQLTPFNTTDSTYIPRVTDIDLTTGKFKIKVGIPSTHSVRLGSKLLIVLKIFNAAAIEP